MLARQHNDSNVLCLGGKIIGGAIAMEIVKTWMHTDPLTAEKYQRRIEKVKAIDAAQCKKVRSFYHDANKKPSCKSLDS